MTFRLALVLVCAVAAWPHVGSPDVFYEGEAGPYRLFVTVRPPQVIPGVAEIEIRSRDGAARLVKITPLPLTGEAAKYPPTPDVAQVSKEDSRFFTGSPWLMIAGSWQVRVHVEGDKGKGEVSVPVPAVAQSTKEMDWTLGGLLALLGVILSAGVVSIVGAAARESQLEPGLEADETRRARARRWMAATGALVVLILYGGNAWWKAEASAYDRFIYKPLEMTPAIEEGNRLVLRLRDPGWLRSRLLDDLIPDHNHLMHLFVVSIPDLNRIWHLHPDQRETGVFEQRLPDMPAGRYQLYADIVHRSGFPETVAAEVQLPEIRGAALTGDDSAGIAHAVLSDGYRMVWLKDGETFEVRKPSLYRFRVEDRNGKPADDLELYMGMQGHAAFVRTDRSVFAHVHPSGSVPMASLGLTREEQEKTRNDPHAGHTGHRTGLPAEVSFPYGIPKAGDYRIFVQVKRKGKVETAAFDQSLQ